MTTQSLLNMMIAAGVIQYRNLTQEYLGKLIAVVGDQEIPQDKNAAMDLADDHGLPESPAGTMSRIAKEVAEHGQSTDLVTLDGRTGDLVFTADKIEFKPLRGGIDWGAAL